MTQPYREFMIVLPRPPFCLLDERRGRKSTLRAQNFWRAEASAGQRRRHEGKTTAPQGRRGGTKVRAGIRRVSGTAVPPRCRGVMIARIRRLDEPWTERPKGRSGRHRRRLSSVRERGNPFPAPDVARQQAPADAPSTKAERLPPSPAPRRDPFVAIRPFAAQWNEYKAAQT